MTCNVCLDLKCELASATRQLSEFHATKEIPDANYRQREMVLESKFADANITFEKHKNEIHQGEDLSGVSVADFASSGKTKGFKLGTVPN